MFALAAHADEREAHVREVERFGASLPEGSYGRRNRQAIAARETRVATRLRAIEHACQAVAGHDTVFTPPETRPGTPPCRACGRQRDRARVARDGERLTAKPGLPQVGCGVLAAAGLACRRLSRMLARRKPGPDRARALSRSDVERLLTREDISLRERTLWRMAYETAARSAGLLALDVEDLDLPGRRAKVVPGRRC